MTDFSRYLIASDIDGTYLAPGSHIVERNLKALERFRAGGGLFTLATGRIPCTMDPHVPFINETLNAPAVVCNGIFLYDFATGEISCEHPLGRENAEELLAFFLENKGDSAIQVSTRVGMFFDKGTEAILRYISPCKPGTVSICSPDTWPLDVAYKFAIHGTPEYITVLRALTEQRFGDRFEITTSSNYLMEVQRLGCTKATGLANLRRATADQGERILIACGDYENDLEMLRAADIAVCPSNAHPAVKAIADYELCSCGEGLIADIIEKIEAGELLVKRNKAATV